MVKNFLECETVMIAVRDGMITVDGVLNEAGLCPAAIKSLSSNQPCNLSSS